MRIKIKEAVSHKQQIFSDMTGNYVIGDILKYIKNSKKKVEQVSVQSLVDINFKPSEQENTDEIPGSKEFIDRAEKTDLSFPIIVVKYDDGDFIADGVHRLWKAKDLNMKHIKAYVLSSEELKNIKTQ